MKMKRNCLLLLIFPALIATNCHAQKIATFEVELAEPASGLDVPAEIQLDDITFLSGSELTLFQIQPDKRTEIPFQVREGEHRSLYWVIETKNLNTGKAVYELVKGKSDMKPDLIETKTEDGLLTIHTGNRNLLGYQYGMKYPPEGVDPAYKRSGFIHPLWSPHGQVLTRIQPPDHFHHYGIWNPWTQVSFEGQTVDFWNLAKKEGTVRFAGFVSTADGPVFCEYQTLHEHVVLKNDGSEKVALNEMQTVRIYQPHDPDYYIADITSQLSCATDSPFKILEYRYAGLGWRATEQWNKDNSEILTSEGKTRKDADGSAARWCIVQGRIDNDYAGVVMMSYPANYNHPEPLRVWPENMNERGDVYANFCPTKNKDWLLNPGRRYVLKYRLLVFNGHCTKEKAESGWQYFAKPPKVSVKMN
jgi:hypothetical protein